MRLLILGGLGFLGAHIVDALRAHTPHEVTVATRHPFAPAMVRVDLDAHETFETLRDFDIIIDAADTLITSPDEAIAYSLRHGLTFIETTSDPDTLERLSDRFLGRHDGTGRLILGVGLFPGLSNLAALHAATDLPGPCASLEVGVALSPFSAAGQGMIRLIVHYLQTETVWYEQGQRHTREGITDGPRLPFPSGPRRTLDLPLAEPILLHYAIDAPTLRAYLAITPAPLRALLSILPDTIVRARLFSVLLFFALTLVRRILFRWRSASVEITARARDVDGHERTCSIRVDDGMRTAGEVVAALVQEIGAPGGAGIKKDAPKGAFTITDVTSLHALRAHLPNIEVA